MKCSRKMLIVGLCAFLTAVSGQVLVGQCGGPVKKVAWNSRGSLQQNLFTTAAFGQEEEGRWEHERELEPIVGLWKISFVDASKSYSDTGYAAWHSDFTEFQNSERAPSTGAVCQGVWEKVGRHTYRLNHFALAYGDSIHLTNIIRIREDVVVDESRKYFSGTFTTTVYGTDHNFIVEYKGPITGKRVTIDSDIDSQ